MESNHMEQDLDADARLRAKAFSDDEGTSALVHHNGDTYEVRAPTPAQSESIRKKSTYVEKGETKVERVNQNKQAVLLVITCTYRPGAKKPLWNDRDLDTFMSRPVTALFRKLLKAINELGDIDKEEVAGKSESPDDSSSIG